MKYSDLEKLIQLINVHNNYIVSLQYFRLKELSEEELETFFNWVKSIEPFGWWIAIDLINGYVCVCENNTFGPDCFGTSKLIFIK